MIARQVTLVAALLFSLASVSFAQEAPAPTAPAAAAPAQTGFQALSPGDQKIVRALFWAQEVTADGPPALSLNEIAALKDRTGWVSAFKALKSQGLVDAKTLNQIIASDAASAVRSSGVHDGTTLVVTGNGKSMLAGTELGTNDRDSSRSPAPNAGSKPRAAQAKRAPHDAVTAANNSDQHAAGSPGDSSVPHAAPTTRVQRDSLAQVNDALPVPAEATIIPGP